MFRTHHSIEWHHIVTRVWKCQRKVFVVYCTHYRLTGRCMINRNVVDNQAFRSGEHSEITVCAAMSTSVWHFELNANMSFTDTMLASWLSRYNVYHVHHLGLLCYEGKKPPLCLLRHTLLHSSAICHYGIAMLKNLQEKQKELSNWLEGWAFLHKWFKGNISVLLLYTQAKKQSHTVPVYEPLRKKKTLTLCHF